MATLKIAPDLYSKPALNPDSGARNDHRVIALATGDLITTQIIALAILPAGQKLMGCALEVDQLDSNTSAAVTISVGILNNYADNPVASPAVYNSGNPLVADTGAVAGLVSGQNIFTTVTTGQAGGRAQPTLAFTNVIGVDMKKDRIIAVSFPTAPGTAKAGNIGLIIQTDSV